MEQIALDMGNLLTRAFPALAHRADDLRDAGLVARMRAGGRVLLEELGLDAATASAWGSDTVRGWAAMAIGQHAELRFDERIMRLRPYADDPHFAVREWAWLALRTHVGADLDRAVLALAPLTDEPSTRLRRFASEVTRPRGVWSSHLTALKEDPKPGLAILEPLRADPDRYVQDSVANWLNDAAKTRPDWVQELCERWCRDSPTKHTARITRRALRRTSS